jgi:peptidoglycan/LPS O-acetylase OafA/YrhL
MLAIPAKHPSSGGGIMRFQALHGWRGLAALLVVVYHSPFCGYLYPVPLVRNGYLFVDLFFVLSGFVISHAYADRLANRKSVGIFLIRRFGRIWPLHAAILTVFVGLELLKLVGLRNGLGFRHQPFAHGHAIGALWADLCLLQSFGLYDHLTWNGPSWSIGAEFWTYAVFAGIFLVWPRRSVLIAVTIAILAPIAILLLSRHSPVADVSYDFGALRCLFGFSVGHLTYRLFKTRASRCSPGGVASWSPYFIEGAAAVGIVGFVSNAGNGAATMAAPFVFAAAIYVFAQEGGPLSLLLRSKPARRLGDWSYSIYMTQALIITLLIELCSAVEKMTGTALLRPVGGVDGELFTLNVPYSAAVADGLTLICLGFTITMSALTFRLVENVGRDYFSRLADRLRGVPETGTRVVPTVVV